MFLPWVATFAGQVSHVQRGFWIPDPDWAAVPAALLVYAGSARLVWLMAPLVLVGLWRAWQQPDRLPGLLLVAWLLCPLILPFLLSLAGSPIFLPKYTIAASVPFALLAATGLAALPRLIQGGAIAAVIVLTLQALQPYYNGPVRKDDWRTAVREIEGRAQPGDVILFYPFFTKIAYDMYETRQDVVRAPFPRYAESASPAELAAMVEPIVGGASRVWLVTMSFDARKPLLVEALASRWPEVQRVSAFHIDAHLFSGP
jgi:hypothetical protein